MADAEDVRRLALALPHVVEIDSDAWRMPAPDALVGNLDAAAD